MVLVPNKLVVILVWVTKQITKRLSKQEKITKRMKKVTKIFGMMCMATIMALGASSCRKVATEVSSVNVSLSTIEGESGINDDSKAYIDVLDNYMKWYGGDTIMMYSIDADYTKSKAMYFYGDSNITGQRVAHFSGYAMPQGSYGFFAFYPASKASATITNGNRVSFNVGDTQVCKTDLFAANASYAGRIYMDPTGFVGAAPCTVIEPYASFDMKHIFGYYNVRVKNTSLTDGQSYGRLKSVTITDQKLNLTGSMSINIPALTTADLDAMKQLGLDYKANGNAETYMASLKTKLQEIGYMSEPEGNSVTLDCSKANGNMGASITNKNKFFLMPLRPGALLGNFTITLKFYDRDDVTVNVSANKQYISIPGYYTVISIDLAHPNGGL